MKTEEVIKKTIFDLGRLHRHGLPPMELPHPACGGVAFKLPKIGCPNGSHFIDLGDGYSMMLCDECFYIYLENQNA